MNSREKGLINQGDITLQKNGWLPISPNCAKQ